MLQQSKALTSNRRRNFLLCVFFPTVTACLGTWQLYRLRFKERLIENVRQSIDSEAGQDYQPPGGPIIDNAGDSSIKDGIKYRLRGRFTGGPMFVGPRSCNVGHKKSVYGWQIVRMFRLEGSNDDKHHNTVLVNCGIYGMGQEEGSKRYQSPTVPNLPTSESAKTVSVYAIRDGQDVHRPWIMGQEACTADNQWTCKDYPLMKQRLEASESSQAGDRISIPSDYFKLLPGQEGVALGDTGRLLFIPDPVDQIPNRHAEYVATWYSIGLTSFLLGALNRVKR